MPVGAPLFLYKGDVFYAPARDLCEDFAPRDGTIRPSGDGGANRASENRSVLLAPDSSQVFDFSSRGTTSLDSEEPSSGWTWCSTRVKALLIRRGAPRRWTRKSLCSGKRGASHASKPCSFVAGHHVIGLGRAFARVDVVLHTRQSLAHSSRGTTSLGPEGSSSGWTWCFTCVKALILRRGAPRRWVREAHRSPADLSRATQGKKLHRFAISA